MVAYLLPIEIQKNLESHLNVHMESKSTAPHLYLPRTRRPRRSTSSQTPARLPSAAQTPTCRGFSSERGAGRPTGHHGLFPVI